MNLADYTPVLLEVIDTDDENVLVKCLLKHFDVVSGRLHVLNEDCVEQQYMFLGESLDQTGFVKSIIALTDEEDLYELVNIMQFNRQTHLLTQLAEDVKRTLDMAVATNDDLCLTPITHGDLMDILTDMILLPEAG